MAAPQPIMPTFEPTALAALSDRLIWFALGILVTALIEARFTRDPVARRSYLTVALCASVSIVFGLLPIVVARLA